MIEKRNYPRVEQIVLIQHQTSDEWHNLGKTFNIGPHGIGVGLEVPIKKSDRIISWRTADQKVAAKGRIAWLDSTSNRCGIQITEIDTPSQTNLNKTLSLNLDYLHQRFHSVFNDDDDIDAFLKNDLYPTAQKLEELVAQPKIKVTTSIMNYVFSLLDPLVEKVETLKNNLPKKVLGKKLRELFCETLSPWIYQSWIMKRAKDKPRGYPGDYLMIEAVYNKTLISSDAGQYFDQYFLDNPYAVSVRNRKDKMREDIKSLIIQNNSNINLLNIACGSCRELKELFQNPTFLKNKITIKCVDQDEEALAFSKLSLEKLSRSPNIHFEFLQENVLEFSKHPEHYKQKLGAQDIIYSIGLVDYIPDRILKNFLAFLYTLLSEKGTLILTHKDIDIYNPLPPNWYCDWNFISRNEAQFLNLVKEVAPYPIKFSTEREPSKRIFFVYINRG